MNYSNEHHIQMVSYFYLSVNIHFILYFSGIQRDLIARKLNITQEQIRIWFQNRRRLQTQRDTGERLATANEISALQHGKIFVNSQELKQLLNEVTKYKDAPPRLRLDESS
jgi:hypothetical protein